METTHQNAQTLYAQGQNATYAHRRFGKGPGVPLLFLIHFRGNMDMWDPLLVNGIANTRPVILLDNAGVGKSTGVVPNTIEAMADNVIDFLRAVSVEEVDVLGFSMGGMIAPLVFLNGPKGLVRKIVLAGTGPSYGEEIVQHPPERQQEVGQLAGQPHPDYDNCFYRLFFDPSETSQAAGKAWWLRIMERNEQSSGEERSKLVSEGYADGGAGVKAMSTAGRAFSDPANRVEGSYDRLCQIKVPVFIGQGKDDFMIPTQNSYVMQQRLPDARLKLFPNSGHGFLYQYAQEFAEDVNRFLDGE